MKDIKQSPGDLGGLVNGEEMLMCCLDSSASHFELRKLSTRLALIQEATRKSGGLYLYANSRFVS